MSFIQIGTDIINTSTVNDAQIVTEENEFYIIVNFVNGSKIYLQYEELDYDIFKALSKLMELLCQN